MFVKFIKQNIKDSVTCCVGDGNNDIDMINVADIGVGILGREGSLVV